MTFCNQHLSGVDVEIKRSMTLNLTADQWELYYDEDVEATKSGGPGRREIARILNLEIAQAFNYHEQEPELALRYAHLSLQRYRVYGAADTEGYRMVDEIAQVFFGDDAVLHYGR
jgi:hypothetical protein